jgi:PAS domain S-box-containing protein
MPERSRAAPTQQPVLDPIITMNSGGVIQSVSDSVEQVFGWSPAELLGRNVKVLIPEPRRSVLDRYLDRYRHAERPRSLQRTSRFEAMRKDGTRLAIELSMSRADIPSHGVPYFIGIVRDVSHAIDVGADAVRERKRLQQLVTEQTRALASANLRLQLSDRLTSLGTLAAGLGHDMNNVLLPVRARLNALEHASISPAAMGHVRAVRRSVAYLQQLSDALHFLVLDPEASGTEHDSSGVTNLEQWWKQVSPLLKKTLPRHVTLKASFDAHLPSVGIAPHWLTQAVLNLLVNAGEAMVAGRRGACVRVRAQAADDGKAVRLSVSDNGRGMTHQVQRKAFDLFFTTKSRSMGTGLGLPLVRKVALRAGGDVDLRSLPRKGTTVALTLPVARGIRTDADEMAAGACVASLSVRDHRAASLLAQILAGVSVRIAAQGSAVPGKSHIWITRPTGHALATAARWRRLHPSRTVVLLGMPTESSRARWESQAAVVIEPPDDFFAMRAAIAQAVDRATNPAEPEVEP